MISNVQEERLLLRVLDPIRYGKLHIIDPGLMHGNDGYGKGMDLNYLVDIGDILIFRKDKATQSFRDGRERNRHQGHRGNRDQ